MENKKFILIILGIILVLTSFSSALTISDVDYGNLLPGSEESIDVKIKNTLNFDVSDVSLNLIFTGTSFIPIGSSEDSTSEIKEDKSEDFTFRIKAANDIKPGDYEIPYSLSYNDDSDKLIQKQGVIGIVVKGDAVLDFSLTKENPILNSNGKFILKIINKGFGNARFLSVKLLPNGFDLLSEDQVYIGDVNSDDFETANFDVKFSSKTSVFSAVVEYTTLDNQKITKNVNIPFVVYTRDEAINLGIAKKNNTVLYVSLIISLIVIWLLYRSWNKRRKLKRAREANGR